MINRQIGPVSKIGGSPWLPRGTSLPRCPFCRNLMTFYIQLVKDETIFSIFSCTKCSSDTGIYPLMPASNALKESVPIEHIRKQSGDSYLILSTMAANAVEISECPVIISENILSVSGNFLYAGDFKYCQIGGSPPWNLRAPFPISISHGNENTDHLSFAFYIFPDYQYSVEMGSSRQIEYCIISRSETESLIDCYELFSRGAIYIFESRIHKTSYMFSVKD